MKGLFVKKVSEQKIVPQAKKGLCLSTKHPTFDVLMSTFMDNWAKKKEGLFYLTDSALQVGLIRKIESIIPYFLHAQHLIIQVTVPPPLPTTHYGQRIA